MPTVPPFPMYALAFYIIAELGMQLVAASYLFVAAVARAPLGYQDEFGFHFQPVEPTPAYAGAPRAR